MRSGLRVAEGVRILVQEDDNRRYELYVRFAPARFWTLLEMNCLKPEGRWEFPEKPAPRAAKSGALRPGRLPLKYSGLWRIPAILFPLRRGCGQRWELPAAGASTSGFRLPGFVASTTNSPRMNLTDHLPHLGGQTESRIETTIPVRTA